MSFLSTAISDATLDKDIATKILGAGLAAGFFALVADLRDVLFLGELPDEPLVSHQQGNVRLLYRIEGDTFFGS